jgi:multisubunit Na+/H+ antiporter MnhB subunit
MRRILRLPDVHQLLIAMLVAVATGLFFAAAEWLRIKEHVPRRFAWAILEGVRIFGFIGCAQIAIWYALRNPKLEIWIACGVLGPVFSALVFNNLHIWLHRKLVLERSA